MATATDEKTSHEKIMEQKNNSIVTIKNIDSKDFEMNYGGVPYSIKTGETLPFVYPVAMHLVKHLSMKIIRKEKGGATKDKVKQSLNLYTPMAMSELRVKIVVDTIDQPLPPIKNEAEEMKQKTEEFQKQFKEEQKEKETKETGKVSEVTKGDIIDDLKERKIKFNPRASKEELSALIIDAEMKGE